LADCLLSSRVWAGQAAGRLWVAQERDRPSGPEMADYPRACSRCGVLTAEADFGADRSKKSRHKSHCRACERADYASRKDELQARRDAVREAARQARLKELEVGHREKVAAAKREQEAGVRRQKKLLRELGVPDWSPEELAERDEFAQCA
jgi:hypothetical protein